MRLTHLHLGLVFEVLFLEELHLSLEHLVAVGAHRAPVLLDLNLEVGIVELLGQDPQLLFGLVPLAKEPRQVVDLGLVLELALLRRADGRVQTRREVVDRLLSLAGLGVVDALGPIELVGELAVADVELVDRLDQAKELGAVLVLQRLDELVLFRQIAAHLAVLGGGDPHAGQRLRHDLAGDVVRTDDVAARARRRNVAHARRDLRHGLALRAHGVQGERA